MRIRGKNNNEEFNTYDCIGVPDTGISSCFSDGSPLNTLLLDFSNKFFK